MEIISREFLHCFEVQYCNIKKMENIKKLTAAVLNSDNDKNTSSYGLLCSLRKNYQSKMAIFKNKSVGLRNVFGSS